MLFLAAGVVAGFLLLLATSARADAPLTQGFEDGAPAWSASGMWHVQADPQTIAVIPDIAQRLVTLPDSGLLPAAFEGTHAAWFGEAATGTYCGADYATINQTPQDGTRTNRPTTGTSARNRRRIEGERDPGGVMGPSLTPVRERPR